MPTHTHPCLTLCRIWIFCLALWLASSASAAEQRFGELVRLSGEVRARPGGSEVARVLKAGDVVYVGERIESLDTGEAVIRVDDAGVIAVRPRSVFYLQGFIAAPVSEGRFDLRIVRGALRLITGLIGKHNPAGYRVQTPTAVVGIRGTDLEPYVMTSEVAASFGAKEGTYNKVNRGSVQLQGSGGSLALVPGQTGFVPAASRPTTRGLLTALLPVLLDQVPGFYLPGKFDEGLEAYAAALLSDAGAAPAAIQAGVAPEPTSAARQASSLPNSLGGSSISVPTAPGCDPQQIAREWLDALDAALLRRDAAAFMALFASNAEIRARVRTGAGDYTETRMDRDGLAQSTMLSLSRLSSFASDRPQTSAVLQDDGSCRAVLVRSLVVERGVLQGRSYQLEALEEYTLVQRAGAWQAEKARTTQQ